MLPIPSYSFLMPEVRGDVIRQRRRRMGLKLQQVADATGVRYKTVANIETGKQVVSIEVVYRLARVLGAEATDLLKNAGDAA